MSALNLEYKYTRYLDVIHFKGYAEQFRHDNEKAFYKGMHKYFKTAFSSIQVNEDGGFFRKYYESATRMSVGFCPGGL